MSRREELTFREVKGISFEEKQPRFGYAYDSEKMERVFRQIGERDVQADIQSELLSCDYTMIMQSLNPSVRDFDFDSFVEDLPKFDKSDPMAIVAAREDMELAYQYLPKEVKAKYGNSPRKFAASIINGEFADSIASWQPPVSEDTPSDGELVAADLLERIAKLEAAAAANAAGGAASAPPASDGAANANQGGKE